MSFTYCQSCGNKNLYSLNPPKFCGGCGITLGATTKVLPAPRSSGPKREVVEASIGNDSEGSDVFEVPQIDKLRYSFSAEMDHVRKIDLKDLVPDPEELTDKTLPNEKPKKRKRGRPKKTK